MNNMFKNLEFGKATEVAMSHLGIAIRNKEGTMVSYDPVKKEIVDVDILSFEGGEMIYKMPVALNAVAIGDTVLHNTIPMFVTDIMEGSIEVVDTTHGEIKQILPTKSPFGFNFITKYVSMFDMMGNQANENNPFGKILPFMMMGKEDNDMESILMAMMMSGGNTMFGNAGEQNGMMQMFMPMLMMKLCSKKDGGSDDKGNFMQMFAMMQMFNQQSLSPINPEKMPSPNMQNLLVEQPKKQPVKKKTAPKKKTESAGEVTNSPK